MQRISSSGGFSLVEVALAMGVAAFALLSLLALLPVGMKANQVSSDETRAVNMLTALEADLRNTHPAANSGKSRLFGLTLPYKLDPSDVSGNRLMLDTTVALNTITAAYSVGIRDDGTTTSYASSPRPRFQVSVIYTSVPATDSLGPTHARLIVNWPGYNATSPAQLSVPKNCTCYVEAYITFPKP